MSTEIDFVHERVDDIPVLIALLLKMRVAEMIDRHFPTNSNRTRLSLGQMCVIWLTFILTEADHRLNQVEPWVAEHQTTLSRCLGCKVEPRDCTDDRLATGLDYLSVGEHWEPFEIDLNRMVIRLYDLRLSFAKTHPRRRARSRADRPGRPGAAPAGRNFLTCLSTRSGRAANHPACGSSRRTPS